MNHFDYRNGVLQPRRESHRTGRTSARRSIAIRHDAGTPLPVFTEAICRREDAGLYAMKANSTQSVRARWQTRRGADVVSGGELNGAGGRESLK